MSRDGRLPVGQHRWVDATFGRGIAAFSDVPAARWALRASAPLLAGFLSVTHLAAFWLGGTTVLAGYVQRFLLFGLIASLTFATLGSLLARAQPRNSLAALAAGISWGFGLSVGLDLVGTAVAGVAPAFATWAVWVAQWTWAPAMLAVPTLLLLRFPDGRLPHPRLRLLEAVAIAGLVLSALQWALAPYGTIDVAPLAPVSNPIAHPALARVAGAGAISALVAAVGSIGVLLHRVVSSVGVERAQLQWVLLGMCGAVVMVASSVVIGPQASYLSSIGVVFIAVSIGIAVLRHRLWDIELVIDRSLTYGLVSVAILLLYAVAVELLGGLLGRTTGVQLAATGLVAVAVLPLRDRAQRLVAGLRYGDRGDPRAALERLGAQLEAAGDRSALLEDVAAALVRAMRLRGIAIVVDGVVVAEAGDPQPGALQLSLSSRGQTVGHLRVTPRSGDPLSRADMRLLEELARHVAQTVRAESLHVELEASRARLVTAREEERRRIRRDLHDELGPTLSAAALAVEQVAAELAPMPTAQADQLQETAERLRETVRNVRVLVADLRPRSLDELGLAGAVHELARRLGIGELDVELAVDDELPELPAAVDAAAYRIIAEALTNVVRHAGARTCRIGVRVDVDALEISVEDDGVGVSGHDTAGIGLASMRRRAEELGGAYRCESRPGGGTSIRASLPLAPP
jgi:two-component system, NarL family, sensor kinase